MRLIGPDIDRGDWGPYSFWYTIYILSIRDGRFDTHSSAGIPRANGRTASSRFSRGARAHTADIIHQILSSGTLCGRESLSHALKPLECTKGTVDNSVPPETLGLPSSRAFIALRPSSYSSASVTGLGVWRS